MANVTPVNYDPPFVIFLRFCNTPIYYAAPFIRHRRLYIHIGRYIQDTQIARDRGIFIGFSVPYFKTGDPPILLTLSRMGYFVHFYPILKSAILFVIV